MELIYGNEVTLEELVELHKKGFEFVIEGGEITNVVLHGQSCC